MLIIKSWKSKWIEFANGCAIITAIMILVSHLAIFFKESFINLNRMICHTLFINRSLKYYDKWNNEFSKKKKRRIFKRAVSIIGPYSLLGRTSNKPAKSNKSTPFRPFLLWFFLWPISHNLSFLDYSKLWLFLKFKWPHFHFQLGPIIPLIILPLHYDPSRELETTLA